MPKSGHKFVTMTKKRPYKTQVLPLTVKNWNNIVKTIKSKIVILKTRFTSHGIKIVHFLLY